MLLLPLARHAFRVKLSTLAHSRPSRADELAALKFSFCFCVFFFLALLCWPIEPSQILPLRWTDPLPLFFQSLSPFPLQFKSLAPHPQNFSPSAFVPSTRSFCFLTSSRLLALSEIQTFLLVSI